MNVTLKHKGLPDGANKLCLWDLVREVAAPAKKLTGRERHYLELAIKTCAEADYLPNRICAFWMRVSKIAEKLVCTPRQVNSIEKCLEAKGFICRTMGRNGTRYVIREEKVKDGPIQMAAAINLAPTIDQCRAWLKIKTVQDLDGKALVAIRAEVQNVRRRVYASGGPDLIAKAEAILPRGRASRIDDLKRLQSILAALQALLIAIESGAGVTKTSDASLETSDASEVLSNPKIQTEDSKRICIASARKPAKPVTAGQAVMLASPRYQAIVAALGGANSENIVEASRQICNVLDIDQRLWGEACHQFSREGAALRVLAIDRGLHLPEDHKNRPRRPGGALVGMIRKARAKRSNVNGMLRAIQGYQEGEYAAADPEPLECVPRPLDGVKQVGQAIQHLLSNVQITDPGELL
jgi:replication initiation protein RepC